MIIHASVDRAMCLNVVLHIPELYDIFVMSGTVLLDGFHDGGMQYFFGPDGMKVKKQ
jgi:hypothetical protein